MLVALALVASGISSLWVSTREWTNFLPATVIFKILKKFKGRKLRAP